VPIQLLVSVPLTVVLMFTYPHAFPQLVTAHQFVTAPQCVAPQCVAPQCVAPQCIAPQCIAPQFVTAPQFVAPQCVAPQCVTALPAVSLFTLVIPACPYVPALLSAAHLL